ncbi:MAG TPA: hypothetical protein DEP66_04610 [Acidimicrobiaceae bacterium]|uniref:DNA adenine methylase n=1 Tax=Microbacterium maritypicum TaxID=33918 RepID=UPI000EC88229|nr:hypothetical protein [Acidimicrobiaceae bacterium]
MGTGAKPFVKWAGGKRSILPELISRLPEPLGSYFEPFVGGGGFVLCDIGSTGTRAPRRHQHRAGGHLHGRPGLA